MELDKEQIELLENALNVASDKFTYAEFSQDEMKLVFDAQHLVKTLTIPVVIESVCKGGYRRDDNCTKFGGTCSKSLCDYWQTVL